MTTAEAFKHIALEVIDLEINELSRLSDRIDENFVHACQLLLSTKGRIVVMGIGKSGHIANKLSATLASTGSPAFFVHPAEAAHGDMGMITTDDVIIAISYSGASPEVMTLLPLIKRLTCPIISFTGNPQSAIAQASTVHLDVSVEKEACPLGLAPTSSTTMSLVLGDALAVALLKARGFKQQDFALSHPGGSLGKRLLLHVSDVMYPLEKTPMVTADTNLKETLFEISDKRLGMTTVVDQQQTLIGIFTDGDIRRALDRNIDFNQTCIADVMTKQSKTTHADQLAVTALGMMEENKITSLVVVDQQHKVEGVVHLHNLLRAGI